VNPSTVTLASCYVERQTGSQPGIGVYSRGDDIASP
jgi:hypothetical protein